MLVLGIALVLVGSATIASQALTVLATYVTVVIIGYVFMVGGLIQVISAFSAGRWQGLGLHLVAGILYLVLGLLIVEHPLVAAAGVTLMIAAIFLVGGLSRIIVAIVGRFHGWGWVFLNGLVSLFLGVVLWRHWTDDSLFIIGLFVGIDMIFAGWSWVMTALAVRSIRVGPV
jgi:uncharacterized membrane protein HdeD (DUF308 family)